MRGNISTWLIRPHQYHTSPSLVRVPAFIGAKYKDQPKKPIYTPRPYPAPWFQKGLMSVVIGTTGYLNIANKIGYGFNEPGLDYGNIWPKWLDRSSKAMWL